MADATWLLIEVSPLQGWLEVIERATPREALAYATLLWPNFVEVGDLVLLQLNADLPGARERVEDSLAQGASLSAIEFEVNSVEGNLLFGFSSEDDLDERVEVLELLAQTWPAKLRLQYPDRSFQFQTDEADGIDGPFLTFWTVRPGDTPSPS